MLSIEAASAEVVELADTQRSGRCELCAHVGSNPTFGTTLGDSLRVEHLVLAQAVGVRIPVPQPQNSTK